MHGSQKCCGELVELTVDDIWQIAVGSHFALFHVHQMKYINSQTDSVCHDDRLDNTTPQTSSDGTIQP